MNVDFTRSAIKIERSMEHTGRHRLKQPKTKNSNRTITLSASAVAMLQEHRRQVLEIRMRLGMGKLDPEAFVFSDHEGRPISPNNLSVRWRRATRPLGMKVKFHSLRHSHASALIAAGIDVVTISRRLGQAAPPSRCVATATCFPRQTPAPPLPSTAFCSRVPIGCQFQVLGL